MYLNIYIYIDLQTLPIRDMGSSMQVGEVWWSEIILSSLVNTAKFLLCKFQNTLAWMDLVKIVKKSIFLLRK